LTKPEIKTAVLLVGLTLFSALGFAREHKKIEFTQIEPAIFSVQSILRDRRGFLWLGTDIGLVRYDGYTSKYYQVDANDPHGLRNAIINSLHEDKNGILWIGTLAGLERYDPKTGRFRHYEHDKNKLESAGFGGVRHIYEDRSGVLWLAMDISGLSRFDSQQERFIHYRHEPDNPHSLCSNTIQIIHEDRQGVLWLGTKNGLDKFDRETKRFIHNLDFKKECNDKEPSVYCLHEGSQGRLWVGTDKGIFVLDRETGEFVHYANDPNDKNSIGGDQIFDIIEGEQGLLWVATAGGGLYFFEPAQKHFVRIQQTNTNILRLYKDQTGIIWVGGEKLYKYDPYRTKFNSYKINPDAGMHNARENKIWSFAEDAHGHLWIGTGAGLYRVDPQGQITSQSSSDGFSDKVLSSLLFSSSKTLWATLDGGGIQRFDPETQAFQKYRIPLDDNIRLGGRPNIVQDSAGRLWVSLYGGGIHRFDPKTEEFTHFYHDPDDPGSLSSNQTYALCAGRSGAIWIGTFGGGLNRLDPSTHHITRFQHQPDKNSISNDTISSIYEGKEGILWLATDGGLDKFDPHTQTFTNYNKRHGLATKIIYSVIEDDQGFVWLGYPQGMSRFDPRTESFRNYNERDGLLKGGGYFGGSCYKSKSGKLYFGGVSGYTAFHPDRIISNPHVPQVVITEFLLLNKPVLAGKKVGDRLILEKPITHTDKLVLSHKDYVFSFGFIALNHSLPERNQYATKMEGLDKDWTYIKDRRFVTYTTLPAGDYTFRVKGSNNDGLWNTKGTKINITITPPFWQTWWFRIVVFSLLAALIATVYRVRVRSIRKQNVLLENRVQQRTAELRSKSQELEEQKRDLEKTLVELNDTKYELIETAHKAGMADTAVSVLHNVGNTINSIVVSSSLITEALTRPVSHRFIKANKLLKENKDDLESFVLNDPRGKKLLDYYLLLEAPFTKEHDLLAENAERMKNAMYKIEEVVNAYKPLVADRSYYHQEINLKDIVESVLEFHYGTNNPRHVKIVRLHEENLPEFSVQKSRLMHVLHSLLNNADEAMQECKEGERTLKVETSKDDEHVYIKISDTGCGIDKAALKKVFSFGYSGKQNRRGFSLHGCANYMTEMGGRMWADSAGIGLGATFVLEFPVNAT
jgi:ligand-binding sensor domain-containing protein/signal transduction histidine kinase